MGDVVELKDPFFYQMGADDKVKGVGYGRGFNHIVFTSIDDQVIVSTTEDAELSKHELKQLMTMWLSVNYPDVLRFDE